VQRVTVRIGFDTQAVKSHKLRPGLSVVATVHTRDDALPKPSLLSALGLEGVWAKGVSLAKGRP
jgi:multidrug resistance efflux pump